MNNGGVEMNASKMVFAMAALLVAGSAQSQMQGRLERTLATYVPSGWVVVRGPVRGDLNRDGQADAVLVLQALGKTTKSADEEGEEKPRWLRVLLSNGNGYRLLAESTDLVPPFVGDEDPCWIDELAEVGIRDGKLKVKLSYQSGCDDFGTPPPYQQYLFREESGRMRLIGYDNYLPVQPGGSREISTSYNYLSGRKKTVTGTARRERWEDLPRLPHYYLDGPMPESDDWPF
ncbi:hypothetical protein CO613_11685 [Lysobacteraceae bacterium NML07-0707]|nr:hypothetical protein CO613_11685 [Xanthomonadaceae bacterium NML07-0707]